MTNTNEEALSLDSSMTAGAISLALMYINKTCFGGNRNAMVMKDDVEKGVKSDYGAEAGREMNARILVVSVSEDMASQYIPVMNSIFAAQRKVPLPLPFLSSPLHILPCSIILIKSFIENTNRRL